MTRYGTSCPWIRRCIPQKAINCLVGAFFRPFAENQHLLYRQILSNSRIGNLFRKCRKENLHAIRAAKELYVPGKIRNAFSERPESAKKPVYKSARRRGYEVWAI